MAPAAVSLLTLTRDLRRRKAREKNTRCVVEGVRATEELVASATPIVGVLLSEDLAESPRVLALRATLDQRGVPVERVSATDFDSAADTDAPQGVLAVAPIPARALSDIPPKGAIIVLDGVQDPGNVGTIVRTAAALGAAATVALPGTVDVWNAKVIRSAVGAQFRHHVQHATWDELAAHLASRQIPLWVAALDGDAIAPLALPSTVAVALGNEGAGVSDQLRAAADRCVSIPISDRAESLNVAIAAGIFLYLLRAP